MLRALVLPVVLSVGALVPPPAVAQVSADTARRIDLVFAGIDRTDAPGCVLGVNRGARPLYRRGYGMASLEFAVPLSEHSVVESGSVAKQFTAGAITHLALAGRLDLDDPVRKYLPEMPDYGAPITVRMLLNHTSGLRDMWTLVGLAGRPAGTVLFSMDQVKRIVYRQRELNFAPNSRYLYSNSGYLLLADVVERISGKSLAEYSRDVFFGPLGMSETQWRNDWNRVVRNRATAYEPTKDGWQVQMPFMSVYGAGGLLTTVGDLLRWNDELSNPSLTGRPWVENLERPGRLDSGRVLEYALGLVVGSYRGEREVSHTGATGGYRTYLGRLPGRAISIAVLCNYATADPERLAHQVFDLFLGPEPTKDVAAATTTAVDPTPYTGTWRDPEAEQILTITGHEGRLRLAIGSGFALVPAGPNRFTGPSGLELRFDLVDGRATRLVTRSVDADSAIYLRVDPPRTTAVELARYPGSYYSDELDVVYRLTQRDTTLLLTIANGPEQALVRHATDLFAAPGGLGLRFTRQGTRTTGFTLFAGRVRNLRFTRRN
ncbi:MAG: beta-lactamase family protein [Gemmatimonadetes bacterium]|nr:beta-lactamase family protein [Gemmatimonadota bacterium]